MTMERIHDDSAAARRANISSVILIAAFFFGTWELWRATTITGAADGYFFGISFLLASVFALRLTLTEIRDRVIALDVDKELGQAVIVLWRPFSATRLETTLDQITGWRHWVQTKSLNRRNYFLFARLPSYPNQLRFELRPDVPIAEELRQIAPEAIADFELESGQNRNE